MSQPFFVEIFNILFSITNFPGAVVGALSSMSASRIFIFFPFISVKTDGQGVYARIMFLMSFAGVFQLIFPSDFLIFLQKVACS